ncbi:hypothetical protein [Sulfurimonas sp.]|uniref:hypothetical protein n=1 Tax=Sulfurimonas sp. TaxID=2022749 RepID=UPI003562C677
MKNLKLTILGSVCAALLSLSLTGCMGEPPKPFKVKLTEKVNNVTRGEKNLLLEKTMKDLYRIKPFANKEPRAKVSVKYSTITRRYDYGGKKPSVYQYQFKVDDKYNTLEMIDKSYNYSKHPYTIGNSFIRYINDYQNNLQKYYNGALIGFSKYKHTYLEHDKQFKNLQNAKKVFIDKTDTLDKNLLMQLSSNHNAVDTRSFTPMKSYLENSSHLEFIYKGFTLVNKSKSYNRYQFGFEEADNIQYEKIPSEIVFNIDEVKYSFIPTKYVSKDKNIKIEVINSPTQNKAIKSFKISNNTKGFIEVVNIAGYYGKDVVDSLSAEKIKIAPMSTKTISIAFPSSNMLKVTSKNQKSSYGFSVSYKVLNTNQTKNLYKVNNYSMQELDKDI